MPRLHIPQLLRRLVIERAGSRCEYCLVHQDHRPESLHVDHIIALKHRGQTTSDNLALACALCNYAKGANLATFDPLSATFVPLFHPRTQHWQEHFALAGAYIVGRTAIGRGTAEALRFNEAERVEDRRLLLVAGLYPL